MRADRTVLLGDVCKFVGGGTPSRKQPEYFEGDIPWATVKDFKTFLIAETEEHISEVAIADSATNIVNPGTVLLVTRVGLGKVAIAGCRLAINQDVKAITPTDDVLPEFLFWFLLSKADDIKRMGAGATVKGVTLNDIKSIAMPVPSPVEQRRIVDILSRAEGIVRLRRDAEKKAAELIPALFLDMFGDPATNPKGWPEHRLGEIAEVVSGVTKGRKFGDKQTVVVPYLRVANVQAGHIDLTELKTIEVLPRDVAQLALQRGDVVMTEGGDFDKLGRGALWELDIPDCIHQNHIFRVRLNQSLALPEFFVTYLLSGKTREYFIRCAKRTTNLASINMTQLRGLPVVLPSIDVQHDFVERFSAMRSIQSQQSAATATAQATFDALLAQVFH